MNGYVEYVAVTPELKERIQREWQSNAGDWIYILEVHDDYRRQGIGTTLVESVIDWASENGLDQVASVSQEIRTEALLLWRKLGFTFIKSDFKDGDRERYGFYVARRVG